MDEYGDWISQAYDDFVEDMWEAKARAEDEEQGRYCFQRDAHAWLTRGATMGDP